MCSFDEHMPVYYRILTGTPWIPVVLIKAMIHIVQRRLGMQRLIEKINRRVPSYFKKNSFTAGSLAFLYQLLIHLDPDFMEQINNAINMYEDLRIPKSKLYHDMICEYIKSWVSPVEYAKYEFYNKVSEERKTYIPDYEEINIFKRTKGNNTLPNSKYERYLMFKEFFCRKVLCISNQKEITDDVYQQFISGKETIVVKPLIGTKGHGVSIADTNKIKTVKEFVKIYPYDCLIEETIQQGFELKQFHPKSVNTVRFVTGMNKDGEFHYIFALIRTGRGGSVIDNVGGGGLVALIDLESGIICSPACGGTERFVHHPDTKVVFQGFEIPKWDELRSLVKTMHIAHPRQRVFGFDMAWTDKGWDLVEVNPAPSLTSYQELTGKGIRPFLQSIKMI